MSDNTVFSVLSSHVSDHIQNQEMIDWVQTHPDLLALPVTHNEEGKPNNFFIKVLSLPEELGTLGCALYGPAAGDAPVSEADVFYYTRGNRFGPSRMVGLPERQASNVAVIGIRGGVCFTMYGSRAASASPKEPWDAANPEEHDESTAFWKDHALSGSDVPMVARLTEGSGLDWAIYKGPIHY